MVFPFELAVGDFGVAVAAAHGAGQLVAIRFRFMVTSVLQLSIFRWDQRHRTGRLASIETHSCLRDRLIAGRGYERDIEYSHLGIRND